jgi:hypothetical protein
VSGAAAMAMATATAVNITAIAIAATTAVIVIIAAATAIYRTATAASCWLLLHSSERLMQSLVQPFHFLVAQAWYEYELLFPRSAYALLAERRDHWYVFTTRTISNVFYKYFDQNCCIFSIVYWTQST